MRGIFLSLFLVVSAQSAADDGIRFDSVDIWLDSAESVAAWQFELSDRNGTMKVVGIENGDSDAFAGTPYYDREAVQLGTADRIVVADYSLDEKESLPSGRIRLATLHLMLTGAYDPAFNLRLVTATTRDGQAIDASISLESPTGSTQ